MNADDLLLQLTAQNDKIVADANRYLNGMVERYRHDLGVMVDQHNRYLERQVAALGKRTRKRAKVLPDV